MEHIIYSDYGDNFEDIRQFIWDDRENYNEYYRYDITSDWQTPNDIPDEVIWEELQQQNEIIGQDLSYALEDIFDTETCLVIGDIGTWRGRFHGGSVTRSYGDFWKFVGNCDYYKFSVDEDTGTFNVKCSHHDGTNYFYFYRLSEHADELCEDFEYYKDMGDYQKARKISDKIINNPKNLIPFTWSDFDY